jgi:molybdopterin/thiamine biosynthesis adenylyltransferase
MDILETMMEEALEATLSTENNTEEVIENITSTEETINEEELIKPNAESLLVDESTSRFSSAIWYDAVKQSHVLIAGLGGIGSYVSLLIARMHPASLILYDPDKVEMANMSGQLHPQNMCGEYKGTSCANLNRTIGCYYNTLSYNRCYDEYGATSDIMICGFDNMSARKLFFDKWVHYVESKPEEERSKCLFIDGRLAAEEFQVFAIQGNDTRAIEEYSSKWLFSDYEAEETICSYKQTTFMANMIASIMVNVFVNFVANECNPLMPRDVPFLTQYSADTMFFKVDM